MAQDCNEDYRRYAERCRVEPARSARENDKAAWLKMALGWNRLAETEDDERARKRQQLFALPHSN
jgi:hypothetical protein